MITILFTYSRVERKPEHSRLHKNCIMSITKSCWSNLNKARQTAIMNCSDGKSRITHSSWNVMKTNGKRLQNFRCAGAISIDFKTTMENFHITEGSGSNPLSTQSLQSSAIFPFVHFERESSAGNFQDRIFKCHKTAASVMQSCFKFFILTLTYGYFENKPILDYE